MIAEMSRVYRDLAEELLTEAEDVFEKEPKPRPIKKINPNKTVLLSKRMDTYCCRNCC